MDGINLEDESAYLVNIGSKSPYDLRDFYRFYETFGVEAPTPEVHRARRDNYANSHHRYKN